VVPPVSPLGRVRSRETRTNFQHPRHCLACRWVPCVRMPFPNACRSRKNRPRNSLGATGRSRSRPVRSRENPAPTHTAPQPHRAPPPLEGGADVTHPFASRGGGVNPARPLAKQLHPHLSPFAAERRPEDSPGRKTWDTTEHEAPSPAKGGRLRSTQSVREKRRRAIPYPKASVWFSPLRAKTPTQVHGDSASAFKRPINKINTLIVNNNL